MDKTKEALYGLIRMALIGEVPMAFPESVDWNVLYDYTKMQGVAAIAMDGLQTLMNKTGFAPVGLDVKTKLQWYALAMSIEKRHTKQLESSKEVAYIWHKAGIRTLVLKGFAFAQYYPKPMQRLASDMDCYLCGGYEVGNSEMERLRIKVNREDYRHATFQYKDVFVENHKICTTVRGKKQRKCFEAYLRSLLENEPTVCIDDSYLEKPCDRFNALYFLQHCHRHFLREGITLRYICDWAMILQRTDCFDSDFWNECEKNDLRPFAESMTRLAYVVCGVKAPWMDGDVLLQIQDRMLLDDCFRIADNAIKYGNSLKAHVQMVKNMMAMRWKYKYFSQRSMEVELISSVWSNWVEKDPKIN